MRNRSHRRLARLYPARQHSPHHLGVVQARSDRGRGTAPRSSDLLAAQAMDPRHPSGVGEPQTSQRLPRGVYLPLQPPPRTPDYSRRRAAPRHRHGNPAPFLLENRWPPSSPRKNPTRRRNLTIMETHFVRLSGARKRCWALLLILEATSTRYSGRRARMALLEKIMLTHGHIDHVGGAAEIAELLKV